MLGGLHFFFWLDTAGLNHIHVSWHCGAFQPASTYKPVVNYVPYYIPICSVIEIPSSLATILDMALSKGHYTQTVWFNRCNYLHWQHFFCRESDSNEILSQISYFGLTVETFFFLSKFDPTLFRLGHKIDPSDKLPSDTYGFCVV